MPSKQSEPKVARYLVESPVKNFVGVGAGGVQFAYGRAEVNEGWVLDWYREKGFKITKIEDESSNEDSDDITPIDDIKPLNEWTIAELKKAAVARGFEVNSKSTKAELLALLNGDDNV